MYTMYIFSTVHVHVQYSTCTCSVQYVYMFSTCTWLFNEGSTLPSAHS